MHTQILKACKKTYIECARIINEGNVVAFPTETVYGLGADASDSEAVNKIFAAKGRPQDNPLIVHLACVEDIEKAVYITPLAKKLINAFMPGPITLVLKKKPVICNEATCGLDTAGVRVPVSLVARDFIKECGAFIAAPSANTSSRPSPTEAIHVYEDLNGRIPAIIDGGKCQIGIESTVVDACGENAAILRPGKITAEDIEKVTGSAVYRENEKIIKSPGVKYRHYAPCCRCVLVKSNNEEFIKKLYNDEKQKGQNPVLLCYHNIAKALTDCNIISLGNNDDEAATALYGALRQGEKIANVILLQSCSDFGKSYPLYNRMIKSSGGNIISE